MKITQVEAIPLAATFEQIYGGLDKVPHHMLFPSANFANVGVPRAGQFTCLVKITTDEGLIGVGEAYGLRDPRVSAAIVEHVLSDVLIGKDPLRIEALWQAMFAVGAFHTEGYQTQAMAAVDIALWDLKGRALGQPISVLLGGPIRESLWVYASPITLCDPDTAMTRAREFLALGFTAIKIKVGGPIGEDVDRVAAVREVVGKGFPLLLDVNATHDARTAIALARALDPFDCFWFEEPVPPEDIAGMAHVRRSITMPVATGEQSSSVYTFRDLIRAEAADVYMPNVIKAGGLSECQRIATLAHTDNLKVAPHGVGSGVGLAATLQWCAAMPNYLIYEYNQLLNPLRHDILKTKIAFEDGYLKVPTGPGLGVEIDWDAVEGFRMDRAAEHARVRDEDRVQAVR
ncbi:MAG: mandelate racemase/muconate lactonizing enzyme family protein [Chloroflexi bacterium]|nr:mandelate racemase/muconate lactonizing enzyme family protein [Chloroflexota bacterium]